MVADSFLAIYFTVCKIIMQNLWFDPVACETMLYQITHYSFLMNSFRFEKLILQVKHTPEDQNYSEVLFITLFLLRFVKSL